MLAARFNIVCIAILPAKKSSSFRPPPPPGPLSFSYKLRGVTKSPKRLLGKLKPLKRREQRRDGDGNGDGNGGGGVGGSEGDGRGGVERGE